MLHEDYERDFLKDVIYLQERTLELEKEALELFADMHRLNAKIEVIKTKEYDGKTRSELLPF